MAENDAFNIEFLDLSDVDEQERLRVRTSLQYNDPSVQLPWFKTNKTRSVSGKPQPSIQPSLHLPPPIAHNAFVPHPVVSPPLVNNIYHNQTPSVTHVMIPPMIQHPGGYVLQSKVVCYASPPIQATYPQQIFIPSSNIHTFAHGPGTYYTMSPEMPQHNGIMHSRSDEPEKHSDIPQEHERDEENAETWVEDVNDVSENGIKIQEVQTPEPVIETPEPVFQRPEPVFQRPEPVFQPPEPVFQQPEPVVQPSEPVVQTPEEPVVQTSEPRTPEPVVQTPPAPVVQKSWASLFNRNTVTNGVSSAANSVTVNLQAEQVIVDKGQVCPIKHPRKSGQFVDPDCYRMGEFLSSYVIDGKTTSLQPRGLLNQSNYCYINSILQALIACPPLYNLLRGLSQNISSKEKRKPTPVIDGMCRFIKEFKHLPASLRISRRSDGKNQKKEQNILINTDAPFEPSWIYKMLNGIRTDLIEGRQEDAEEFLGCLLNGLNDEMLDLIKLVKNDTDQPQVSHNIEIEPDKEWQVMGPRNKGSVTRRTDFGRTPISDIFGGFLKSRIHRTGDHITENIQPFFTLQLNIEKVKTVREALEALTNKYQLEGLTSSKTNEEVEAWQQVMLDELPVILILHLKCFDFKLDGCTKIIKALEFPIDLKVETKILSSKTQTPREKQYKLFAVVYHDGKEASKGHYVTDAFHVGYSSWLHYDDASVKMVQEEQVLKPQGTRVPYLLFYRRCDTIRGK